MGKPREDRSLFIPAAAVLTGILAFAGLTVLYVTLTVTASNHRWCATIDLLNSAPAPAGKPARNPARAYEQKLAADFRALKKSLGC